MNTKIRYGLSAAVLALIGAGASAPQYVVDEIVDYLKQNGITSKVKYNQVANYIYLDTQVNKAISDDAPNIYFTKAWKQCEDKNIVLGNISDKELLSNNLAENCIPDKVKEMTFADYEEFLQERRKMMAKLIEKYYKGL